MNTCAAWLQARSERVSRLEEQGKRQLEAGDGEAYRRTMREKAELLANLAEDADSPDAEGIAPEGESPLSALAEPLQGRVRRRLAAFSSSAASALQLDSVFFMSALLYSEDHKPGQPDDLQRFVDEVRAATEGRS